MTRRSDPAPAIRPDARGIARILLENGSARGRYGGELDDSGGEWLRMESADVADAIADGRDPADILTDTGYWEEEDGPFPDDLRQGLKDAWVPIVSRSEAMAELVDMAWVLSTCPHDRDDD